MIVVDGNKIANKILDNLKKEIENIKQPLCLAVILVGKNKISASFVKKKEEAAKKIGVDFKLFNFPASISNRQLRQSLAEIIKRRDIHGIIIQLPLPDSLNCQYILDAIPPNKDVDVLSSLSLGNFYTNKLKVSPPVVAAVLKVLNEYDIKMKARQVVIIGSGRLTGKPLLLSLLNQRATVSVLNKFTPSLADYTKRADILISGAGQANIINHNIIKKGAVVIDAGMSVETLHGGKSVLKGDIDSRGIEKKAKFFVPSSGGLGPITVAMVMKNLVKLIHYSSFYV